MPEDLILIWILAVTLGAACLAGYAAHMLKVSPILGYLLAGYFIGPNSPGIIINQNISDQLATVGVTLLMFVVGLNFNWKDIGAVKSIVLPGALILSFFSICAGMVLTMYLGGSVTAGFVVGVAICVSSTVVIVRVLADNKLLHTKQGHIAVAWTIVEDLISVMGLIILPSLAFTYSADENQFLQVAYSIAITFFKVFVLGLIIYFAGNPLIERILKIVARTRSHELFTLAILTCVFMIAVGSSYYFGISIALGAFIAGTVVGRTELSHQAAANALPMRDAFAVIFFLSVGMLFNPRAVVDNLPMLLGILAILLVIRPLIAFTILKIAKYPNYVGFTLAMAISQIGEYSFILAEEGSSLNILPDSGYDILVACAFISIALNPFWFQIFRPLTRARGNRTKHSLSNVSEFYEPESPPASFLPRALVVGYGPVGKTAVNTLKDKFQVTVIDQNIDTVSSKNSVEMVFGDASQVNILERLQLDNTELLVITIPDPYITRKIIRNTQLINPNLKLVARVQFEKDCEKPDFENLEVVCDEKEAAEKMEVLLKETFID